MLFFFIGIIAMIKIDAANAITPPSLFGMDRKIAYANKKYHSGWIWIGVFRGLAGLKFSGSPILNGMIKEIHINKLIIANKPIESFDE